MASVTARRVGIRLASPHALVEDAISGCGHLSVESSPKPAARRPCRTSSHALVELVLSQKERRHRKAGDPRRLGDARPGAGGADCMGLSGNAGALLRNEARL